MILLLLKAVKKPVTTVAWWHYSNSWRFVVHCSVKDNGDIRACWTMTFADWRIIVAWWYWRWPLTELTKGVAIFIIGIERIVIVEPMTAVIGVKAAMMTQYDWLMTIGYYWYYSIGLRGVVWRGIIVEDVLFSIFHCYFLFLFSQLILLLCYWWADLHSDIIDIVCDMWRSGSGILFCLIVNDYCGILLLLLLLLLILCICVIGEILLLVAFSMEEKLLKLTFENYWKLFIDSMSWWGGIVINAI